MAPHPARSAACPELCTAHLLSPGFAGYPSAQLPAITHSSNKCHQAFPTQVKLFLGGVARSEEGERRTPACWRCDSPAAPEMAFPARHHCPSPATLLCHSQAKHRSAAHQSQRYLNTYSFKVVGGKEGVFVLGFWKRKGVCRVHKERSLEMEALFSPSIERVRTGGRRRSKTALWFSPQECPPQELDLQDETEAWWHSPHPQGWSKPSDLLKDEFRDAWQSREFVTRTLAGMGFPSRVAEKDQIPR